MGWSTSTPATARSAAAPATSCWRSGWSERSDHVTEKGHPENAKNWAALSTLSEGRFFLHGSSPAQRIADRIIRFVTGELEHPVGARLEGNVSGPRRGPRVRIVDGHAI